MGSEPPTSSKYAASRCAENHPKIDEIFKWAAGQFLRVFLFCWKTHVYYCLARWVAQLIELAPPISTNMAQNVQLKKKRYMKSYILIFFLLNIRIWNGLICKQRAISYGQCAVNRSNALQLIGIDRASALKFVAGPDECGLGRFFIELWQKYAIKIRPKCAWNQCFFDGLLFQCSHTLCNEMWSAPLRAACCALDSKIPESVGCHTRIKCM